MRAIAATSAAAAGRIKSSGMASPREAPKTTAPRPWPGRLHASLGPSAPIARQAQQHQEQVDEVEIERKRPHDHFAARHRAVAHALEHLLDLWGIPGGEAGEHDHAARRST